MSSPAPDRERALKRYARLVALYPEAHRAKFGPPMLRTFEDVYRHATEKERRVGIGFWLAVLWDEGRSIVRERAAEPQGDGTFYAFVLMWVVAVLTVPLIPSVRDWRNLVLPTAVLAVLFLAIPGTSGIARRLVTVAVGLGVVEAMTAVAQSMRQPNDLLAPVLLVACLAFAIKIIAGANARIVGIKDGVWGREELTYGVLAGLAGVVGLGFNVVDTSDGNPAIPIFFYLVVPFVCGFAGFRVGRRTLSVRSGIYAAIGASMIGATIWFLALPLEFEGALLTVYRGHTAPTLLPLYWGRPLAVTLFWASIISVIGAFFGVESTRNGESVPQSPRSFDAWRKPPTRPEPGA